MQTLERLAEIIKAQLIGDPQAVVRRAQSFEQSEAGDITFAADARYRARINECRATAIIVGSPVEGAAQSVARHGSIATVKRWAVQIGVYADQAIAEAQLADYAQRALDVLGQAQKLVVPYTAGDGHTLYRARFGTFAENEARDICRKISQRGDSCFAAEIN